MPAEIGTNAMAAFAAQPTYGATSSNFHDDMEWGGAPATPNANDVRVAATTRKTSNDSVRHNGQRGSNYENESPSADADGLSSNSLESERNTQSTSPRTLATPRSETQCTLPRVPSLSRRSQGSRTDPYGAPRDRFDGYDARGDSNAENSGGGLKLPKSDSIGEALFDAMMTADDATPTAGNGVYGTDSTLLASGNAGHRAGSTATAAGGAASSYDFVSGKGSLEASVTMPRLPSFENPPSPVGTHRLPRSSVSTGSTSCRSNSKSSSIAGPGSVGDVHEAVAAANIAAAPRSSSTAGGAASPAQQPVSTADRANSNSGGATAARSMLSNSGKASGGGYRLQPPSLPVTPVSGGKGYRGVRTPTGGGSSAGTRATSARLSKASSFFEADGADAGGATGSGSSGGAPHAAIPRPPAVAPPTPDVQSPRRTQTASSLTAVGSHSPSGPAAQGGAGASTSSAGTHRRGAAGSSPVGGAISPNHANARIRGRSLSAGSNSRSSSIVLGSSPSAPTALRTAPPAASANGGNHSSSNSRRGNVLDSVPYFSTSPHSEGRHEGWLASASSNGNGRRPGSRLPTYSPGASDRSAIPFGAPALASDSSFLQDLYHRADGDANSDCVPPSPRHEDSSSRRMASNGGGNWYSYGPVGADCGLDNTPERGFGLTDAAMWSGSDSGSGIVLVSSTDTVSAPPTYVSVEDPLELMPSASSVSSHAARDSADNASDFGSDGSLYNAGAGTGAASSSQCVGADAESDNIFDEFRDAGFFQIGSDSDSDHGGARHHTNSTGTAASPPSAGNRFDRYNGTRQQPTEAAVQNVKRRLIPLDYLREMYLIESYLGEDEVSQSYRVRERKNTGYALKRKFVARFFFTDKGKNFFSKSESRNRAARADPRLSQPLCQQIALSMLLDHPKLVRSYDFFYHSVDDAKDIESKMQSVLTAGATAAVSDATPDGAGVSEIIAPANAHLNPRLLAKGELGLARKRVSLLTSEVLLPRRASFLGRPDLATNGGGGNGNRHGDDEAVAGRVVKSRGHRTMVSSSSKHGLNGKTKETETRDGRIGFSSVEVGRASPYKQKGGRSGNNSSGNGSVSSSGAGASSSMKLPAIRGSDSKLKSSSEKEKGKDGQRRQSSVSGAPRGRHLSTADEERPSLSLRKTPASSAGLPAVLSSRAASTAPTPVHVVSAAPAVAKTPQQKMDELFVKLNNQVYHENKGHSRKCSSEDSGDGDDLGGVDEESIDLLFDTTFIYGVLISDLVSGPMPPMLQAERRNRSGAGGNGGLDERLVSFYAAEVCDVLTYLHNFATTVGKAASSPAATFTPTVIHNNLRGEHILVDSNGGVKVSHLDSAALLTARAFFEEKQRLRRPSNSKGSGNMRNMDTGSSFRHHRSFSLAESMFEEESVTRKSSLLDIGAGGGADRPSTGSRCADTAVPIPFPIVPIDLTAPAAYTAPELAHYTAVLRYESDKQRSRRIDVFTPLRDAAELMRLSRPVTTQSFASFNYRSSRLVHDLTEAVTTAVDCYQLGVTLYRLLLGELPKLVPISTSPSNSNGNGSNSPTNGDAVIHQPGGSVQHMRVELDSHPRYNTLSAEARDLLAGLLAVTPEKRLTVQQVLAHPFLKIASGNATA